MIFHSPLMKPYFLGEVGVGEASSKKNSIDFMFCFLVVSKVFSGEQFFQGPHLEDHPS